MSSDIRFHHCDVHSEGQNVRFSGSKTSEIPGHRMLPPQPLSDEYNDDVETLNEVAVINDKNMSLRSPQYNDDLDTYPRIRKVSDDMDFYPIFELFNPAGRVKFNDINRWDKVRRKRDLISKPEHTEVFRIKSRRSEEFRNDDGLEEVPDFKREQKPKSFWDLMNIMENIKMSFFNSFFDTG